MKSVCKFILLISVFVLATWGHPASGASLVLSSSSGGGVFTLQGSGMQNATGIDVTIRYDRSTLSHPRIVRGDLLSGAMMAANLKRPGIIRIAAVKNGTMQDRGVIATISFQTKKGRNGKIRSLRAKAMNSRGTRLRVKTEVLNPPSQLRSRN